MGKVNADLHNHLTTFSKVNGLFNKVVDKARISLGSGGVLVVVNYLDNKYESLVNQSGYDRTNIGNAVYVPNEDILIVKGQEIPTKQGDFLVLGLNQNINLKPGRSLEDTCKEAKDNSGITIAVHPFYFAGIGNYLEQYKFILDYIDGIEIHNGSAVIGIPGIATANANKLAQNFYREILDTFEIGALSCSDGHSLAEIGSSYIKIEKPDMTDAEKLSNSLRKSIKAHKDFAQDKQTNFYWRALEHMIKLVPLLALRKMGLIKAE